MTLDEAVPDLPPRHELSRTPAGRPVFAFRAAGKAATNWWQRLRAAHPETGLWPVLMDDDTPEYLAEAREHPNPSYLLHRAGTLDGAATLAARARAKLEIYGPELAAEIQAELRGEGEWPTEPVRRDLGLPFTWRREPRPVTVALVPAVAGWQVPAVLAYGGWNDHPSPSEHGAILRHWQRRYGIELMTMTGTTVELMVDRPPTTRPEALAAAWDYWAYNDGAADLYDADGVTKLAASLLGAPLWLAWWD
ncbi:DUF4253 domain-containing protein [Micromonospora sp. NPDC049559]|uniref:DUF4253 domain-containing protein n=1 Tax=Micromonospora sp. NPDC049559 TaxID=3155923 RepID=UPI0034239A81